MKTLFFTAMVLASQADGFGGTQPNALSNPISPSSSCATCHGSSTTGGLPNDAYRGTMMDLASVDPLFEAALEIAFADSPAAAELCVRCHTPTGWLGGRSTPTNGAALTLADKHGISCDICHRAVVPTAFPGDGGPIPADGGGLGADGGGDAGGASPTIDESLLLLENTQLFLRDDNVKNGPYDPTGPNPAPATTHGMTQYPLLTDSRLCAHCHEVTNPILTRKTIDGTDTGVPMPIERTYTEWKNSRFSGPDGETCQECHMKAGNGPDATSGPSRAIRSHEIVGGNTVAPHLVAYFQGTNPLPHWPQDLSADAERITTEARRMLAEESADLTAESASGGLSDGSLTVRLTNKTGHKLPTGYAEGRRMWVAHEVKAGDGTVTAKTGTPDPATFDVMAGEEPERVWEIKLGQSGVGESFHFALADVVFKDNRIPPEGFVATPDIAPVGHDYPDLGGGILAHYDDVELPLGELPCYPAEVTVTVYFQAVSGEYFRFLRDNAPTKGPLLAQAFAATGVGGPEIMQQLTVRIDQAGNITPLPGPSPDPFPGCAGGPDGGSVTPDSGPAPQDAGSTEMPDGGLVDSDSGSDDPADSGDGDGSDAGCACNHGPDTRGPLGGLLALGILSGFFLRRRRS
jgi:MYXO-CTERM domain-containing protein